MPDIEDYLHTPWDCVVVGTGIGGATLGHALAQAGQRVLFLEKGRAGLLHVDTLRGSYPELQDTDEGPAASTLAPLLARGGRCHEAVIDAGDAFVPLMGCGSGGSSALYGMAMERFLPADFEAGPTAHAAPTSARRSWPIRYDDLAPWYEAAERLYRVRGGRDPLRPAAPELPAAPALSAQAEELQRHFRHHGLHPYALPLACERLPGCTCCQGYLCARECKNDADRICLQPALREHGAALLDNCEVERLETDADRVSAVVCNLKGRRVTLRARQVVLAAGALNTPALLLRSATPAWPQGLANRSGQVGRNLMRHFVDLYLVLTRTGGSHPLKEIGLSDFYETAQGKLGTLQSFGQLPPARMLAATLGDDLRRTAGWAMPLFNLARSPLEWTLTRIFGRGMLLAAIMEDTADADNRVLPGQRLEIAYRPGEDDLQRLRTFRRVVRQALRPYRVLCLHQAEKNRMLAHACGTCRFGADPRDSVLDPHNRAHGIANLYVVDASFFPTSGGTNPGLTIAANALRVARHMVSRTAELDA